MKRGQLRRYQVGIVADFVKAASHRRGPLGWIVEPLVIEVALAVHLKIRDVRAPAGDVAEAASPCVEIFAAWLNASDGGDRMLLAANAACPDPQVMGGRCPSAFQRCRQELAVIDSASRTI
jgi:hypothetical protein